MRTTTRNRSTRLGLVLAGLSVCGLVAACSASPSVRSGSAIAIGGTTTSEPVTTDTAPVDSVPVDTAPVDTEAPTTTAEPTTTAPLECIDPSNLPTIVAAEETGYDTVQAQEGLGAGDKRITVLFTAGGAVAAQNGTGTSRSIEYRIGPKDGGGPKGSIPKAVLFDLVPTAQGPAILYGAINTSVDPAITSSIVLFDIGSGTSTTVADMTAESYSYFRASASNGRVLASARTPNKNVIETWAINGSGKLDRFSPTTGDGDGDAFIGPALLTADGKKMLFIEGPDPALSSSRRRGDWYLWLVNAESGEESFRFKLGGPKELFRWLDWDGSWAILSRGYGKTAIAVNTADSSPEIQDICNSDRSAFLTGTITLVRRSNISTDA